MDNEIKTWLYDILQAITDIESFFEKDSKQLRSIVINHLPPLKLEVTEKLNQP
jgi:uncharacterized protein with HEPN domain